MNINRYSTLESLASLVGQSNSKSFHRGHDTRSISQDWSFIAIDGISTEPSQALNSFDLSFLTRPTIAHVPTFANRIATHHLEIAIVLQKTMAYSCRNYNHVAFVQDRFNSVRILLAAKAAFGRARSDTEDFVSGGVEMSIAEHSIAPLRTHDSDG